MPSTADTIIQDEFGLSKNQLMPHFEEYLGRFDIEMEEVANGT